MPILPTIVLCLLSLTAGAADRIEHPISEHFETLASLPLLDWTITKEPSTIVLTSKFDVFFVGTISRISSPPPFKEVTPEAILRREGAPRKYVIRLEYERRISRDELERRLSERKKFADALTHGASGKDTWSQAATGYREIRVPRYSSFDSSVYRVLPEGVAVLHYPPSASAKIGAALHLIDLALGGPKTPYD